MFKINNKETPEQRHAILPPEKVRKPLGEGGIA